MRFNRWATAAFVGAAFFFMNAAAHALIRVDTKVSELYQRATEVVIAKVAQVDGEKGRIVASVKDTPKGTPAGSEVRLESSEQTADFFGRIAQDQPVVIIAGIKSVMVHLSDEWFTAERVNDSPLTWKLIEKLPIQRNFPGRTAALVEIIEQIKTTGKSSLISIIEHDVFQGYYLDLGAVIPHASFAVTADLNGDRSDEVLVGNSEHVQLLLNKGGALSDVTSAWNLSAAKGRWAAFGDINGDGQTDLWIGNALWIKDGERFTEACRLDVPADAQPLAVALSDVTGDKKPDAIMLTQRGELLAFKNPGSPRGAWQRLPSRQLWDEDTHVQAAVFSNAWGDDGKLYAMLATDHGAMRVAITTDGAPAANHERLTGEASCSDYRDATGPWEVDFAIGLEINGDDRLDFFAVTKKGGLMLVNRGFGAFIVNPDAQSVIHPFGGSLRPWGQSFPPGAIAAAGDIQGDKFQDLLIVTPAGRLFEARNLPYPPRIE